jgi:hypothetical protein
VATGAWIISFLGSAVLFPYPLEYREGASLVLTRFLLEGKNPFTLQSQPLGTTNYGALYNVAVLPVVAILGNTLLAHRLVTVASIMLTALLVFQAAHASRRWTGPAILAAQLVAVGVAARGGLAAFPTGLGTLLYVAAQLIPQRRGFDRRGLAASTILCLFAFYTKPYFVLPIAIVGSYVFLFHSKSKGLAYVLGFGVLFAASFLVVRASFPLYFFDTVISNRLQAVSPDPSHLPRQLAELGREFYPAVLAVMLLVLGAAAARRMDRRAPTTKPLKMSLNDFRGPLLPISVDYFAYASVCSGLAFLTVLGPNPGSYLTYAFQIVLPPFMLWLIRSMRPWRRLTYILVGLLLFNLVLYGQTWMNPSMLRELARSTAVWEKLYAQAERSDHLLNTPVLAAEMVGRGVWPVDTGQTEYYFGMGDYRWSAYVGPDQATINADGLTYLDEIRHSLLDGAYDLLILTDEPRPPLFKYGVARQAYHETQILTLPMPLALERWDIQVWEPDSSPP